MYEWMAWHSLQQMFIVLVITEDVLSLSTMLLVHKHHRDGIDRALTEHLPSYPSSHQTAVGKPQWCLHPPCQGPSEYHFH